MKILLVSATQQEIWPLVQQHLPIDVLITGVGTPATVYELTHHLVHNRYQWVLQAGVAGSFGQIGLQQVVAVSQDGFADLGAWEQSNFKTLQQLNLTTNPEYYVNASKLPPNLDIPFVKGITVNTLSDQPTQTEIVNRHWQAHLETMEGAALHLVCNKLQMPYLQIRAISNWVGDRNKDNWQLTEAIEALNLKVGQIIKTLHS